MSRLEFYIAVGLALLAPFIAAVFHSPIGFVVLAILAIVFFTLAYFSRDEQRGTESAGILFPDGIPQPSAFSLQPSAFSRRGGI
jgi:hypothetical protein